LAPAKIIWHLLISKSDQNKVQQYIPSSGFRQLKKLIEKKKGSGDFKKACSRKIPLIQRTIALVMYNIKTLNRNGKDFLRYLGKKPGKNAQ
jgi:hypothetical protein